MKKILITASFLLAVTMIFAQQDQQYTQFMYNKLSYNPAYAGSNDAACLTAVYRKQWIGLEGAPETQVLSFNMPFLNKRVGAGLNLSRNTIGISETWTLDGSYAYRLRLGHGYMSIGLQGSVRYVGRNFLDDRLVSTSELPMDSAIDMEQKSKYVPNFGAGLYYNTEKFYVGLSAPRILANNIDFNDVGTVIGREVRHFYLMSGVRLKLAEKIELNPQVLLKYAASTPFDVDFNLNLIFMDRFTVGATYRTGGSSVTGIGESIDLLVGAQITDHILLALSYDITLSELKDYNSGSIEAAIRYCFGKPTDNGDYINPRFF